MDFAARTRLLIFQIDYTLRKKPLRRNPESDLKNRISLGAYELLPEYCQYREARGDPLSLWELISLNPDPIEIVTPQAHFHTLYEKFRKENKYPISIIPYRGEIGLLPLSWQIWIPGYGGHTIPYLPFALYQAFGVLKAAKFGKPHQMKAEPLPPQNVILILTHQAQQELQNIKIECEGPETAFAL